MFEKIILLSTVFFLLVNSASASPDINISVEVVVPIGNYSNSSLNLTDNETTLINASEASTILELASSQNVSGTIDVMLTPIPLDIPTLSIPSLDKYLRIEVSESISANLTHVLIKLYYTDEEINTSGIEEGSLSFYRWNQTSSEWEELSPSMDWVYGTGVDTMENYVWANVTHFSDYSVGGLIMPPSLDIERDMPLVIKTSQKFDIDLNLYLLADFELYNISVKEIIPDDYILKDEEGISPRPLSIEYLNDGSTVINWRIDKLETHENSTLEYSLLGPKSAGKYLFKAKAFGYDVFDNKYTAVDITKQEVKKPPLWKSLLSVFGLDIDDL